MINIHVFDLAIVGNTFCIGYKQKRFNLKLDTVTDDSIIIIIIIIIGSIPRRAFQYLFTSDTFSRLINIYKNDYKRNW
jgi:hypothetical protein